jgi:LacI family transcriptional regulator
MNFSELARHLGVSATTVSRVLGGKAEAYRISEETVARVRAAAARLEAAPDPLGAGLRRGTLGMIGLLVPDVTNPFFSSLARAIELELRRRGLAVQLSDSAEDPTTEEELLAAMLGRRLDGMILAPVGRVSPRLEALLRGSPMPLVVVDRVLPHLGIPSVCLDNAAAGRLAVAHLIQSGHRRIGCLRGNRDSHPDQERFRGIREAMGEAGLGPEALLVAGTGYSREEGLAGAEALLNRASPPTAVVSLSGQGIFGLLQTVERRGLAIPQDLSVVAFDEQPWSAFMHPPLTTVVQPIEEMGRRAVEMLCETEASREGGAGSAGGGEREAVVRLRGKLESRESVRTA